MDDCCLLAYYNKEEDVYICQSENCRNFKLCQQKIPNCLKESKNNLCIDCYIMFGKHNISKTKEVCPSCLKLDEMIMLPCNHKLCNDCWFFITKIGYENNSSYQPLCPVCNN